MRGSGSSRQQLLGEPSFIAQFRPLIGQPVCRNLSQRLFEIFRDSQFFSIFRTRCQLPAARYPPPNLTRPRKPTALSALTPPTVAPAYSPVSSAAHGHSIANT